MAIITIQLRRRISAANVRANFTCLLALKVWLRWARGLSGLGRGGGVGREWRRGGENKTRQTGSVVSKSKTG